MIQPIDINVDDEGRQNLMVYMIWWLIYTFFAKWRKLCDTWHQAQEVKTKRQDLMIIHAKEHMSDMTTSSSMPQGWISWSVHMWYCWSNASCLCQAFALPPFWPNKAAETREHCIWLVLMLQWHEALLAIYPLVPVFYCFFPLSQDH